MVDDVGVEVSAPVLSHVHVASEAEVVVVDIAGVNDAWVGEVGHARLYAPAIEGDCLARRVDAVVVILSGSLRFDAEFVPQAFDIDRYD